jgi:hypothetical protein
MVRIEALQCGPIIGVDEQDDIETGNLDEIASADPRENRPSRSRVAINQRSDTVF